LSRSFGGNSVGEQSVTLPTEFTTNHITPTVFFGIWSLKLVTKSLKQLKFCILTDFENLATELVMDSIAAMLKVRPANLRPIGLLPSYCEV
jgi:hypothetical protein